MLSANAENKASIGLDTSKRYNNNNHDNHYLQMTHERMIHEIEFPSECLK